MTTSWKLHHHLGQLTTGALQAQLDIACPASGLQQLRLASSPLNKSQALGLTSAQAPLDHVVDHYVRGTDLVVTYGDEEGQPLQTQIYWRILQFGQQTARACGVELIASVQTSSLDSDATEQVESLMPVDQLLHLLDGSTPRFDVVPRGEQFCITQGSGTGLILVRLPELPFSFAQYVHPRDFDRLLITPAGDGCLRIRHRLFSPGLEKGVIRRGRAHGVFVTREDDQDLAIACYEALRASSLPLTT